MHNTVTRNYCRVTQLPRLAIDKPKHRYARLSGGSNFAHGHLIRAHKPRLQDQVFGRIPRHDQFGKHHNVASRRFSSGVVIEDAARIAGNIAHEWIDLGQPHPHFSRFLRHGFRLGVNNFTKRSHLGNGGEIPIVETMKYPNSVLWTEFPTGRISNAISSGIHLDRRPSANTDAAIKDKDPQ